MADSIERLHAAVLAAKRSDPAVSRTARLLRSGDAKIAKKLAEEAVEVAINTVNGDRDAMVRESADLIYNLVVAWASAGVHPGEVWQEMDRRERLFGIAEKLMKNGFASRAAPTVPRLPITASAAAADRNIPVPQREPGRRSRIAYRNGRGRTFAVTGERGADGRRQAPALRRRMDKQRHRLYARAMLRPAYDWCIAAADKPHAPG